MKKTVDVKGQKYKIKICELKDEDDTMIMGRCDTSKKVISINEKLNQRETDLTFMHELVHAAMHEVGLDQITDTKIEELLAENISSTFYKVFFKARK